jgi:hypothetical protein
MDKEKSIRSTDWKKNIWGEAQIFFFIRTEDYA